MRFRSRALAVGRRLPMLFTHSTRFSRARIFIACIFDSGSPSQSLEKQTMSLPCRAPIVFPSFACRSVGFGEVGAAPSKVISGARADASDGRNETSWTRRQSSSTQRANSSSLRSETPCLWSSRRRAIGFSPNRRRANESDESSPSRSSPWS